MADRQNPCKESSISPLLKLASTMKTVQTEVRMPLVLARGGCTSIMGHIRDVRPEWMNFPGQKPADECKFLTKNLRMGPNFDIILPGNGWLSSKLNKIYCSLVNFGCK